MEMQKLYFIAQFFFRAKLKKQGPPTFSSIRPTVTLLTLQKLQNNNSLLPSFTLENFLQHYSAPKSFSEREKTNFCACSCIPNPISDEADLRFQSICSETFICENPIIIPILVRISCCLRIGCSPYKPGAALLGKR